MDLVFMVRASREYEELRYALRSMAAHLPHERVWVYGGRPSWLSDRVIHVPVTQGGRAHANTAQVTAAIGGNRSLSERFYWCHDDMFVLAPVASVPVMWRCEWPEWEAAAAVRTRGVGDPYGPAKTRATAEVLAAFGKRPRYSYELHMPMPVERDVLAELVQAVTVYDPRALERVQKRSLYGNWADAGGRPAADVKIRGLGKATTLPAGAVFTSTNDAGFRFSAVGEAIRAAFPDPSPYERHRRAAVSDVQRMAGHLGAR